MVASVLYEESNEIHSVRFRRGFGGCLVLQARYMQRVWQPSLLLARAPERPFNLVSTWHDVSADNLNESMRAVEWIQAHGMTKL